jgi:hypothetical protein
MKPDAAQTANHRWPSKPLAAFFMKHASRLVPLFIVAASMSALPLFCTAQSPTPPPSAVTLPQNLHASGTISAYDAKGLTVLEPITGSMTVYLTNADTSFVDTHDHFVSPDLIAQQIAVKVHYTRVGNALLATKVVVNTALNTDGTLLEVSPGVVVIQLSGAPATPVHFVSHQDLKFVNQKGAAVLPQAVKLGAQVRVFYSKTGDALVASKVEMR